MIASKGRLNRFNYQKFMYRISFILNGSREIIDIRAIDRPVRVVNSLRNCFSNNTRFVCGA